MEGTHGRMKGRGGAESAAGAPTCGAGRGGCICGKAQQHAACRVLLGSSAADPRRNSEPK